MGANFSKRTLFSSSIGGQTTFDRKDASDVATTVALPANTRTSNTLTASSNGTLTSTYTDGVTPVAGLSVLVKNEATGANNGIYVIDSIGSLSTKWSMTRRFDADESAEVTSGMTVPISQGTVNAGAVYVLETPDPITLNSTSLTFAVTTLFEYSANKDASGGYVGLTLFKINFKNVANTFTSFFTNSNTASRTYTFPDRTGTVALNDGTGLFYEKQFASSDETTALTTGVKLTFRMPRAMTVTSVRFSLTTAQTSGSIFTVDVLKNGVSILSTLVTIDNTEKTSVTAATPPVISTSALADDDEITVNITQIGDGTAKGLKGTLIGVGA